MLSGSRNNIQGYVDKKERKIVKIGIFVEEEENPYQRSSTERKIE